MKTKLKKILAIILSMLMLVGTSTSAFAASYSNKSTVKIQCKTSKTYKYDVVNDFGTGFSGLLEVKKGGATSADKVILSQSAPTHGAAKIRYLRVSITTTDGKTNTVQKKLEMLSNGNTKVTTTTNGKATVKTYVGLYEFYKFQTISVSGTLWKAAKSVYASTNMTGGNGGEGRYIYFNT